MQTPNTHAAEFIAALEALGFKPSQARLRIDETDKAFDLKNGEGHLIFRVILDYQMEIRPHGISLYRFDGKRSSILEWDARNISARAPSEGFLTLIKASMEAQPDVARKAAACA
jgi:hypothetical protein